MRKSVLAVFLVLLFSVVLLPGCAEKPVSRGWEQCAGGGRDGIFVDEGYYYTVSPGYLYFMDVNSGVNVCLCSKVGCTHNSNKNNPEEHCEARIGGTLVCYWDGGIYYVETSNYGSHLYRRNADGTGEQQIMQLSKEYTEAQKEVGAPSTWFADGIIYYSTTISDVSVTEDGSFSAGESQIIKRIDLRTKTEVEILSVPIETIIRIVAIRPDALLCLRYQFPDRDDEQYEDLLGKVKYELIQLDTATGQIHVIMEKMREDGFKLITVSGNTALYEITENGQRVARSLDLNTGNDKLLYATENLAAINEDYGIRLTGGSIENMQYILVDIKSGKDLPTEFKGQRLTVQSVSDDGVILLRTLRKDGESTSTRILSYFTLESLKDGLQEQDAIDFYIIRGQSAIE